MMGSDPGRGGVEVRGGGPEAVEASMDALRFSSSEAAPPPPDAAPTDHKEGGSLVSGLEEGHTEATVSSEIAARSSVTGDTQASQAAVSQPSPKAGAAELSPDPSAASETPADGLTAEMNFPALCAAPPSNLPRENGASNEVSAAQANHPGVLQAEPLLAVAPAPQPPPDGRRRYPSIRCYDAAGRPVTVLVPWGSGMGVLPDLHRYPQVSFCVSKSSCQVTALFMTACESSMVVPTVFLLNRH